MDNLLAEGILALIFCHLAHSLSPVVIIPGTGGNQLEAKLIGKKTSPAWYCDKTTKDYFTLWLAPSSLLPFSINCWADNIRLEWDMKSMSASNVEGVLTKVPGFGQTSSIETLDTIGLVKYMKVLVDELTVVGYVKGINLRAAPYDFRYSPESIPANYIDNLQVLIEESFKSNKNQSVTIISHSYGCPITLYFLSKQSQQWKSIYIKQWIALAGVFGGTIQQVLLYASGLLESVPSAIVNPLNIRAEQRSSTSNLFMLPSASLWENDEVIVTTKTRSYKISEIDDFLQDIGFPQGVEMRRRILSSSELMKSAPGVPVYCYYGRIPNSTTGHLLFAEGFPDIVKSIEKREGDGTVNHESLSLCNRFTDMQAEPVSVNEINGVDHTGILTDQNVISDIKALLLK